MKLSSTITAILLLSALPTLAARAESQHTRDLVKALAGDNESARSAARQVLPRQGLDAVPLLLPLVAHENPSVWRAAVRVLADIANATSIAGREAERTELTRQMMSLIEPGQSAHNIEQGLRLLQIALAPDADVTPIGALLRDPVFRERAREILVETGTRPAAQALYQYLPEADPDFTCAVLDALGQLKFPDIEGLVEGVLKGTDATLSACAARALSWTGDVDALPAYWRAVRLADDTTRFETSKAFLRLLESIAERGGNWDLVLYSYRGLLAESPDPVIRGAALAGLGEYGDETVIPEIVEAVKQDPSSYLVGPASEALAQLQGRAAARGLVAVYEDAPATLRYPLLALLGNAGEPSALTPIQNALQGDDPAGQRMACMALADLAVADAVSLLLEALGSAGDELRPHALKALWLLADRLGAQGVAEGAGRAYLALYKIVEEPAQRDRALEGIRRFPIPEAYEVLLAGLEEGKLESLPVATLADIAKGLRDAGHADQADSILDSLVSRAQTTQDVQALLNSAGGLGPAFGQRLGFINEWMLVGPFPWKQEDGFTVNHVGAPDVDLSAKYGPEGDQKAWARHTAGDASGMLNLAGIFGMLESVKVYGFAEISVPEEVQAVFRVGSDDGIALWVNGERIHSNNVDRGMALDQDAAGAVLHAGKNQILVQVTQGGGGWNFCCRVTQVDGAPLGFSVEQAGLGSDRTDPADQTDRAIDETET